MIDEDFYDPTVIGFVLAINADKSDEIKKQLVSSVRKLESDDRCYMHHSKSDFILYSAGNSVKGIADWRPPPEHELKLGKDIQQTMIVLANEDEELEKHMFIILDRFESDWDYDVTKALKMSMKLGCGVKFHFCIISEDSFDSLEKIASFFEDSDFNRFENLDSLQDFITSKYRKDERDQDEQDD